MNPNHYLAVAISYLYGNRTGWPASTAVGKTLVSSAMIDRVAARLGRRLYEVPVGFKWFADGLFDGGLGFGGEESAGASFLRRDGTVWTTDKDGIAAALLAAEITARTGRDPGLHYPTWRASLAPFRPIASIRRDGRTEAIWAAVAARVKTRRRAILSRRAEPCSGQWAAIGASGHLGRRLVAARRRAPYV